MKEIIKKNSNGWYAIAGSVTSVLIIMIFGFRGSQYGPYFDEPFVGGMILAVVGLAISVATLFCGKRWQRDSIYSALMIVHFFTFILLIVGSEFVLWEQAQIDLSWAFILFGISIQYLITIIMDSIYEGVGNYRDKHNKSKKTK